MRERRTMAELTGILTSLFVMLLIDFPAATTGQVSYINIDVRDGDDVTLSCEHVESDQDKCDSISWLLNYPGQTETIEIITHGQTKKTKIPKSKSDRLSVTENCSLVLKKVTVEDVGQYTCRQFDTSGREQGPDSVVVLSVVTMTEQKLRDKVTFSCQVFRYDHCHQSVKWLFQDKDVDQNNKHFQTSQTNCYANVTFLDSHFIYSSRFKLFKCEVTNTVSGKVQKFIFNPQSSGQDTTTTTTTEPTTTNDSTNLPDWGWGLIAVTVSLAVLVIIVLLVQRYKRRTGKKTQTDGNTGLSLNTAGTQSGPETSQDTADPEDGVSYASVSYTKKTKSKAQVHNEDEDDAVTYSTVKVSSSSAADPSSLYASVN